MVDGLQRLPRQVAVGHEVGVGLHGDLDVIRRGMVAGRSEPLIDRLAGHVTGLDAGEDDIDAHLRGDLAVVPELVSELLGSDVGGGHYGRRHEVGQRQTVHHLGYIVPTGNAYLHPFHADLLQVSVGGIHMPAVAAQITRQSVGH